MEDLRLHLGRSQASGVDDATETLGTAPSARTRAARSPRDPETLLRGTTLGRYVVLDVVGRGGMGVVYAAWDPELNRKVGLKLLRPPAGPRRRREDVEGRLLREAQALARLHHPNVITVFDVGTYQGRIFLAMEYVEGRTLDAWLFPGPDRPRRTRRQILDVFRQAGMGLEAAHSAGLVHRDFKPKNVMVATDGRVVVLDFGLAREADLDPGGDDEGDLGGPASRDPYESPSSPLESPLTETGAILGTPAYMAPEQHLGRPAGPAADQFAFCVTLYQALYGELPFTPPKRLAKTDESTWTVAEAPPGSGVPAWCRRLLLKGLRFDPLERHASMRTLLDQLARDPWESRRRALAAAFVLILAAAGFLGYRSMLDRRNELCHGASEKLSGIWDAERRRAIGQVFTASGKVYAADVWEATRTALDDYTQRWSRMHTDACEATHRRGEQSLELLDLRMSCLEQSRQEVRTLVALLESDGVRRLDRALEAVNALTPVNVCANTAALTAPVAPPAGEAERRQVDELRARLATAKAYQDAGEKDRSLTVATDVLRRAEELGYWPLTAEALYRVGVLEGSRSEPKGGATLVRALEAAIAGGHERVAADALIRLVWEVGYRQADFEQGLRYADQARAVLERLGPSQERQWHLADNLGTISFHQGHYDQALEHHRRALELKNQTLRRDHLDMTTTLIRLGNVYTAQALPGEALEYYERAYRITEDALGPRHPRVASILDQLGRAHFQQASYELARRYHERALAVSREALGEGHSHTARILVNLATVDFTLGAYEPALERYLEAFAILEGSVGSEHPQVAMVQTNIALTLSGLGKHGPAIETFQRALATQEKTYGHDHPWVAETVFNLGVARRALGQHSAALRLSRRAMKIWEATFEAGHPRLAYGLTGMGEDLLALGSPAEARELLERALEIRLASEPDATLVAETRFALAQALDLEGVEPERASELARQAVAGYRQAPERNQDEIAAAERWLASHT